MLKPVLRIAAWVALVLFLLLRGLVGVQALVHLLGAPIGVLVAVLLLLAGWLRPLRIAAFFGLIVLWHWPLLAALLVAAPRWLLMLPGLISTLLARLRHPRPRWVPR